MPHFKLSIKLNISPRRDRNCGMGKWIDDKIQRIKNEDEHKTRQEQVALRRDEIIKKQGMSLWEKLRDSIQEDVERYNQAFQGDVTRLLKCELNADTKNRIMVQNQTIPHVLLDVRFDGRYVQCTYRTLRHNHGQPTEDHEVIGINVDNQDRVQFAYRDDFKTPDQVVGIMLERLLPRTNGE
jgi:hypothetical protein